MLAWLLSPIGRVVAAVVAIGAVVAWLRWDAAQIATRAQELRAARQQEITRHEADKAARAAERDGAATRLNEGRF